MRKIRQCGPGLAESAQSGQTMSGIGGFNLGGVGGILSVVAAKAGLKAMAI